MIKTLILQTLRSLGRLWCSLQGAELGESLLIHGFPVLRSKNGGAIRLAKGVTINAALWSNPLNDGRRTVLHADGGAGISIGEGAGLSSSRLIAYSGITVGPGTLIGAGCLICDSDMHEVPLGSPKQIRTAPISIGKSVFVGANTTILKGVSIGDGTVIGANSVVTSSIPASSLAAGNPAKVVRLLEPVG